MKYFNMLALLASLVGILVSMKANAQPSELAGSTRSPAPSETMEECLKKKSSRSTGQTSEASFKRLADTSELPVGLGEGSLSDLQVALQRQLDSCNKNKANLNDQAQIGECKLTRKQWCIDILTDMLAESKKAKSTKQLMQAFKDKYDWYQLHGPKGKDDVQFTGYYSPTLEASRRKTGEFKYPLYRQPKDLIQYNDPQLKKKVWRRKDENGSYVEYHTRQQIEEGALAGQNLEIAYVKDPLDISDFMIEGAGTLKIREPGGKITSAFLNYAAANGQANYMPAKVMRCMGVPAKDYATSQAMRDYFAKNPGKRDEVLSYNPSYVFFKEDKVGPTGVNNIVLTPKNSLACDKNIVPIGFPSFYTTETLQSLKEPTKLTKVARIGICQDVGGAIKGQHFDIFEGGDALARLVAETRNSMGQLFVPVPRGCGLNTAQN